MGWDENMESKGLRIVIFQNLFSIDNYNEDIKGKLIEYIEENIGEVERSRVFKYNPDGIVEIKLKKSTDAERCIEEFNNKNFNGRIVQCYYWDGKTDFRKVNFLFRPGKLLRKNGKELKTLGNGWKTLIVILNQY
jgi:RNA recognition motif. (a.k.a. RRM, RBD, or RNP domain)